ncbi:hypothetical protein HOK76_07585 [archaeon]|nr:hypothetical protein [archaeon]
MISKKTKKELLLIISFLIFSIVFVTTVKILTGSFTYTFGSSDMHIYTAGQMKILEPELFENDVYFSEIFKTYPNTVNYFLAFLINLFGNMNMAYIFVNYLLFIIFWLGNYQLAKYIFRSKTTGIIFALLSAFGTKALFGTYWGIILGQVSTRDFVTAFVPLLLYYYLKYYKDKKKIMLLFFVIGVLTNIHMITAISLLGILIVDIILKSEFKKIFFLITYFVSFFFGSIPFFVKGIILQKVSIPVEILHFRIGYQYMISLYFVFVLFFVPTCLFLLGISLKNQRNINKKDKTIVSMLIVTIIASIFLFLISLKLPIISSFQFMRINKFIILFLLLYGSHFLSTLYTKKEKKLTIFTIICIFILLIPSSYIFLTLFPNTKTILLYDFRGEKIQKESDSFENIYYKHNKESIIEVIEWIEKNTPTTSKVFINPHYSSLFRVFSKRSVYLSYKDGGNLILTRNAKIFNWYNEIIKVIQILEENDKIELLNLLSGNVDYIILEQTDKIEELELKFENEEFTIYYLPTDLN